MFKSQVNDKIKKLEYENTKLRLLNGYCYLRAGSLCNGCTCIEDYSLVEKYYCDCRNKPARRDCKEHYLTGEKTNGVYKVTANLYQVWQVFCDQTTDGGGWTVFQRRLDGSVNFYRNWTEYEYGFGRLHHEHWLGNYIVYLLTAQAYFKGTELRVDMRRRGSSTLYWAKYSDFEVNGPKKKYHLHVSGYSGNAGDKLSWNNNMEFSTYDQENDLHSTLNCAVYERGAWWYNKCTTSNLNGDYDVFGEIPITRRVTWRDVSDDHLQFTEMKLRRM